MKEQFLFIVLNYICGIDFCISYFEVITSSYYFIGLGLLEVSYNG